MSWHQIKKIVEVWPSLILSNNNEPFFNQFVMCNEKQILYDNQQKPAQWLDWDEAPKHFPKPNLHQKKVMVTVWWSAAHLIHYSFLNPSETSTSEKYAQQINEMHKNCKACSQYWSTEGVQFFSTAMPDCTVHNQCCKTWMNWAKKFCHIHHIHLTCHQLTTTSSSISTTSWKENSWKEFVESWSIDFYATRIDKLIPHWQKCVDYNGFYFD